MDFDDDAQLDASQVQDSRGGGFPGGGLALGGGAVGIVGLIISLVLGLNVTGGDDSGQPDKNLSQRCRTGRDADQSEDCRIVGTVNSIQRYWTTTFTKNGRRYEPAKTKLFSQAVQTGCGSATSQVGPFYCPADQQVYLDLTFFQQLQKEFGAEGGSFAQAYVVGHEYGHHVQNLLGTSRQVKSGATGANSGSVRLELQADCYAGTWARNAVGTGFLTSVSQTDLRQAISAAEAVGDDRIQRKATGRVQPDSFTHGTSEQRRKWFTTGYSTGDPDRCDTFSGAL